jgi:hypothetical protein
MKDACSALRAFTREGYREIRPAFLLTFPPALWFSVKTVKVTFVPVYMEPLTGIVGIHAGVRR